MELLNISEEIKQKVKLLENMRAEIRERAERKSAALADYNKQMAITIIKLKNKSITEWEGEEIKATASNEIEKIAKGMCWEAKLEKEKATALYKALISNIDAVQAELNGYQSINRHLGTA